MIKAVFLDFDGTTYSHKIKKIPDSACEAILTAQTNGVKVLLSTGRTMTELERFDFRGIKFDGYVLVNGQLLMDKDHNIISAYYIEGEDKQRIIDYFNSKTFPMMIGHLGEEFMNYIDDDTIKTLTDVDSKIPQIKKYDNENMLMATIFAKDKKDKETIVNKFPNLNITWWHDNSADLLPKGSSKATGIQRILKHYNISLKDSIAIGDAYNDIEMLEQSEISIAMGNSTDEIKKIADYVTTDIDDDGLYNAFKKYNII